jgi:hypothetical protein
MSWPNPFSVGDYKHAIQNELSEAFAARDFQWFIAFLLGMFFGIAIGVIAAHT